MKKQILLLPVVALLFVLVAGMTVSAAAAEDAIVAESYTLEFTGERSALPVIEVPDGCWYNAELFEASDTEMQSPLSTNGSYTFEKLGEYRLRYTVYDSALQATVYTARLSVVDTTAPQMQFDGSYSHSFHLHKIV